jgi:hypothetical protein
VELLIENVLVCVGLVAAVVLLIVYGDLLRDVKKARLLNVQIRERNEFCMDQVLSKAATVAVICNRVRRARNSGKRPKWTIQELQELQSAAFNLMKLVEDNVHTA